MFQIGNRVVRRDKPGEVGTVMNVTPNVQRSPEFTIYEVEFPSGRRIIHGHRLRALYPSCEEWQRLLNLCQRASEIYFEVVSELADAAEVVAHTEFELLQRRVAAAKELRRMAQKLLTEHSAKHGC